MSNPARRAALALLLAYSPLSSAAEQSAGHWYSSLGLGWNYAKRLRIDDIGGVIDFDFGLPAGSLAVGINTAGDWRFELEASHQEDAPEILFLKGTDVELDTRQSDRLATTSFMFNAIRDFHFGTAVRPYLGLGIGTARSRLRFTGFDQHDNDIPTIDDASWVVAYQTIAGLTLPLSRRLALGIEYRYWQAPWPNLEDLADNDIDSSQSIHSGWLRLTYQPDGHGWNDVPRPRPAAAADPRGFYLSAAAGGGWGRDRDLIDRTGQLDAFAIGPMGSVAVGYRLGSRWRVELEAARRRNKMQIFDFFYGESRTTGDIRADSLAMNIAYRFRPQATINPWIGAGGGIARVHYDLDLAAQRTSLIKDTDKHAMAQLLMGFDIALSPRWLVTADYRLLYVDRIHLDLADGGTLTTSHMINSWAIGFRYSLRQP